MICQYKEYSFIHIHILVINIDIKVNIHTECPTKELQCLKQAYLVVIEFFLGHSVYACMCVYVFFFMCGEGGLQCIFVY